MIVIKVGEKLGHAFKMRQYIWYPSNCSDYDDILIYNKINYIIYVCALK